MDLDATYTQLTTGQPFNVQLLSEVIQTAYDPVHPHRATANKLLMALQQYEGMWSNVDKILESPNALDPGNQQLLFFALQVLDDAIQLRWNIMPPVQRSGIRNYIVQKIISVSTVEGALKQQALFLNKLNLVLIQIVKKEWPHNWPSFITDLVSSSQKSEQLCENNMRILMLLSEEVFDFGKVCLQFFW